MQELVHLDYGYCGDNMADISEASAEQKVFSSSGSGTLASIALSTESLIIDAIDVSNAKILEVQLTCTFNAAATAGATVNLYASVDGITYDTVANANTVWVTAINSPVSAGNVRTKT